MNPVRTNCCSCFQLPSPHSYQVWTAYKLEWLLSVPSTCLEHLHDFAYALPPRSDHFIFSLCLANSQSFFEFQFRCCFFWKTSPVSLSSENTLYFCYCNTQRVVWRLSVYPPMSLTNTPQRWGLWLVCSPLYSRYSAQCLASRKLKYLLNKFMNKINDIFVYFPGQQSDMVPIAWLWMVPTPLWNGIIIPVSDDFKVVFDTSEIIPMKVHCKMINFLLIKIYHYQTHHVFISMCTCILTILGLVFEFSHLKFCTLYIS